MKVCYIWIPCSGSQWKHKQKQRSTFKRGTSYICSKRRDKYFSCLAVYWMLMQSHAIQPGFSLISGLYREQKVSTQIVASRKYIHTAYEEAEKNQIVGPLLANKESFLSSFSFYFVCLFVCFLNCNCSTQLPVQCTSINFKCLHSFHTLRCQGKGTPLWRGNGANRTHRKLWMSPDDSQNCRNQRGKGK